MVNKKTEKFLSSYVYYVCLDEDQNEFRGNVFPINTSDSILFSSFDDFIIKMDTYMDENGPQSFQNKRSLTKTNTRSFYTVATKLDSLTPSTINISTYKTAYVLCMLSRRNTEWQGTLYGNEDIVLQFSNILDLANFFANRKQAGEKQK